MKKQLAAICLLAGTAIGSGMIYLPIVLAKCGITASCILFIIFAIITYIRRPAKVRGHEILKTSDSCVCYFLSSDFCRIFTNIK